MMSLFLIFSSFLLIAFLLLVIIVRYQRREKTRQADLDAHMAIFAAGIEKMARQDGNKTAENSARLVQGENRPPSAPLSDALEENSVVVDVYAVDEVHPGWNYGVALHEGVEQYLGTVLFGTLSDRFSGIPGVVECSQEDRDLFLFRTRRLSPKQLRTAVWLQFLAAADEVRPG